MKSTSMKKDELNKNVDEKERFEAAQDTDWK